LVTYTTQWVPQIGNAVSFSLPYLQTILLKDFKRMYGFKRATCFCLMGMAEGQLLLEII
jgi:hypothetical protein